MFPSVFDLLYADAAVAALVGTRIYRHGSAPQDVAAPYITWFVVYGAPENHLDGTPPADNWTIQIDCWSNNTGTGAVQVETLARAVRTAIEPHHYIEGVVVNERDRETMRYRIGLQCGWWDMRDS